VPFPRLLAAIAVLALAGCGGLPRPFEGNPGRTAALLAQPPPARLAVPPPGGADLTDEGAKAFAADLAASLGDLEVPAVAGPAQKGDWQLVSTAELHDAMVVPMFEVDDPDGVSQGVAQGAPVSAAAWAGADRATLRQAAANAAPSLASLLGRIDAARRQSDPNSLVNRPARVLVKEVTGAPGDGDAQLTRQMRLQLPQLGQMVQDTESGADFVVTGHVVVVPVQDNKDRVEIQWVVTDPGGTERGHIVQLNEVPRGTLSGLWGDVALVVAQEAAGGVHDVVLQQSGRTQATRAAAAHR
jgi:hypothetical protein